MSVISDRDDDDTGGRPVNKAVPKASPVVTEIESFSVNESVPDA